MTNYIKILSAGCLIATVTSCGNGSFKGKESSTNPRRSANTTPNRPVAVNPDQPSTPDAVLGSANPTGLTACNAMSLELNGQLNARSIETKRELEHGGGSLYGMFNIERKYVRGTGRLQPIVKFSGNAATWRVSGRYIDDPSTPTVSFDIPSKGDGIVHEVEMRKMVPVISEQTRIDLVVEAVNKEGEVVGDTCVIYIVVSSPIVLDFSVSQVFKTESILQSNVYFDLNGDGSKERVGWISKDTALLVWDRNHNGTIESGEELFGEHTAGTRFENGYLALKNYDLNRDGVIDNKDPIFSELALWFDHNIDGVAKESEIESLSARKVTGISAAYKKLPIDTTPLANQVRFASKFFGPAHCPKSGCNSYDVFFATMSARLNARK